MTYSMKSAFLRLIIILKVDFTRLWNIICSYCHPCIREDAAEQALLFAEPSVDIFSFLLQFGPRHLFWHNHLHLKLVVTPWTFNLFSPHFPAVLLIVHNSPILHIDLPFRYTAHYARSQNVWYFVTAKPVILISERALPFNWSSSRSRMTPNDTNISSINEILFCCNA